MRFENKQIWPSGNALSWMKENMTRIGIDKKTKITSIGSCFAREIKSYLQVNGYNYLVAENKSTPWEYKMFTGDVCNPNEHSSIAWERVYNTFTLRHIADYTYGEVKDRLIQIKIRGKKYIADIIRNRIIYKDLKTARKDIKDHSNYSRNILNEAELIILTFGTTEIWRGRVTAASNQHKYFELPSDFKFHVSTYEENKENMEYFIRILKKHNPKVRIVVTVSPVHLLNTFRDMDVITASCASKSILRAVCDSLKGVMYFPSYEIATIGSVIDGVRVYPDNHHISKKVVKDIMSMV
jgi:hypothetical protein